MEPIILNVKSLPSSIRGKFNVKKVSVKEEKENIILIPIKDDNSLWGILPDNRLSSEKFLKMKRKDEEVEKWKNIF